jgi:hypothetical protein
MPQTRLTLIFQFICKGENESLTFRFSGIEIGGLDGASEASGVSREGENASQKAIILLSLGRKCISEGFSSWVVIFSGYL